MSYEFVAPPPEAVSYTYEFINSRGRIYELSRIRVTHEFVTRIHELWIRELRIRNSNHGFVPTDPIDHLTVIDI